MIQSYHHGRFEFFVAVIVIAIIALFAIGRYSILAEDARILRLEIISHHFMTGAANLRAQFLVKNISGSNADQYQIDVAGKTVYFSDQGWPASVIAPVTSNYRVNNEDCYQLWELMLQNPAPIAVGFKPSTKTDYQVVSQGNYCRYQTSKAYFDYFPLDGRLAFISE